MASFWRWFLGVCDLFLGQHLHRGSVSSICSHWSTLLSRFHRHDFCHGCGGLFWLPKRKSNCTYCPFKIERLTGELQTSNYTLEQMAAVFGDEVVDMHGNIEAGRDFVKESDATKLTEENVELVEGGENHSAKA